MDNVIFLAQSDTTAGFLSRSDIRICEVKQKSKAILLESCDLAHIKQVSRIPPILNKSIRRIKKTSFIFPNNRSFRVVCEDCDVLHYRFLRRFGMLYSSSANKNTMKFDYDFAFKNADIIIYDNRGIYENTPSRIFNVRKNRLKKIR